MFFNFKKKATLRELMVKGYTDIHNHTLPGIDDGSKSVENTAELLTAMGEIGFENIIATPHTLPGVWNNTQETIMAAYNTCLSELPELSNRFTLRAASEYLLDSSFSDKLANKDNLLTLKDNYLLVELSYLNPPIALMDIIFEIQMNGFVPVLAHPERYLYYHNDKEQYKALKQAGCLFQINLLSAVGYYGRHIADIADYLIKNDFIDYSGSDIHHIRHIRAFDQKVIIKSIDKFQVAMERNFFFKK